MCSFPTQRLLRGSQIPSALNYVSLDLAVLPHKSLLCPAVFDFMPENMYWSYQCIVRMLLQHLYCFIISHLQHAQVTGAPRDPAHIILYTSGCCINMHITVWVCGHRVLVSKH